MNSYPGRFITFEGGDGAGKSTQIRLIADWLREEGKSVVTTREPGGSKSADLLRHLLVTGETGRWDGMTEVLLHFAARREHLIHTVFPALERGDWVISDRFADSTVAYQGYGLGVSRESIAAIYQIVVGDFHPDLTMIFDLSPETGLSRAEGRPTDGERYENMDLEFHKRLREGFLAIAEAEPDRCAVIDATLDAATISAEIEKIVRERLINKG